MLIPLAVLALALSPTAEAAIVRMVGAGQLRLPALPGAPLSGSGAGVAMAPPSQTASLSLESSLPPLVSPQAPAKTDWRTRPLLKTPAKRAPTTESSIGFFYNDHNASPSYLMELADFVARHDEILVESLSPGLELEIFQSVADGKNTPQEALELMPERQEPMDAAILKAVFRTGVRILPEPVHENTYKDMRRRIDEKLLPEASDRLSRAFDSFIDEGDAEKAVKSLRRFNALMVEVHILREQALVKELRRRYARKRPQKVGVIFGMFHTQPYHELRRQGVRTEREFHPQASGGKMRSVPYNRPLRALRFDKPYRDAEAEKKDTLSLLLFYAFLDHLYRMDRFPSQQTDLYDKIASRLSWGDWEEMAEAASDYSAETGETAGDKRMARYLLRWLEGGDFIRPKERRFFKLR